MVVESIGSVIRTKPVVFENYEDAKRYTKSKVLKRFEIVAINELSVSDDKVFINFILREDEGSPDVSKWVFTPRYTYGQLCRFLNIPTASYDYFLSLNQLTDETDRKNAIRNEGDHLYCLFNKRLENSRNKTLFLHVVSDNTFGTFARCISSENYVVYTDDECLRDYHALIEHYNAENGANYEFSGARATPYEILFGYVGETREIFGDEVKMGIAFFNSDAKKRSVHAMNCVFRILCSNGVYSLSGGDEDLTVPHLGEDFEERRIDAFHKVIGKQNEFFELIKSVEDHDRIISEDWNDFLELPSKFIAMRPNDKKELIEIAEREGYPFNVWGIVQALTWKSSHDAESGSQAEQYNEKAMQVVDLAEDISLFVPPVTEVATQ